MLLTLGKRHLNPHQATSVLGQIIPNDLSLNPTVNYRMNSLITIVPYPWKVLFISLQKNSQCKQFKDNVGGDVHQSNDTVREFHLHLSDSNLQNVTLITVYIH